MSGHTYDGRSIKSDHDDNAFPLTKWTKEWFDYAFTNPVHGVPYDVPADIRRAAERICVAYGIRGICDPMYIANVIAVIGRSRHEVG